MVQTRSSSDGIDAILDPFTATLDKIAAKLDSIGSFKEDIAFLKRWAASIEKSYSGDHLQARSDESPGVQQASEILEDDVVRETHCCEEKEEDQKSKVKENLLDFPEEESNEPINKMKNSWTKQKGYPIVSPSMKGNELDFGQRQPLLSGSCGNGNQHGMMVLVPSWFLIKDPANAFSPCSLNATILSNLIGVCSQVITYPTSPWIVFIDFDLRTSRFSAKDVLIRSQQIKTVNNALIELIAALTELITKLRIG